MLSSSKPYFGFSYVAALLMMAAVSIGLMASLEVYSNSLMREKEAQLINEGSRIRRAIKSYYEVRAPNGMNEYPKGFDDLVEDRRWPSLRRHLRRNSVDPISGKAWGVIEVNGRMVGVHSVSSRKPIKQDGFDPENLSFASRATYQQWQFRFDASLPVLAPPGR